MRAAVDIPAAIISLWPSFLSVIPSNREVNGITIIYFIYDSVPGPELIIADKNY